MESSDLLQTLRRTVLGGALRVSKSVTHWIESRGVTPPAAAEPPRPAVAPAATPIDDATLAAIATALALESASPLEAGPPEPSVWRTAARIAGVQRLP